MPKKKVYVIDTNILIDYMDIIQNGEKGPIEPTIDLSDAHLVIPMVVIYELSKFKKEKSDRGKSARAVLRRLRELVEGKPGPASCLYNGMLLSLIPYTVKGFLWYQGESNIARFEQYKRCIFLFLTVL